jgi:hypothetical protein
LKKVEIFAPKKEILVEITPQKKEKPQIPKLPPRKKTQPLKVIIRKCPKFLLIFMSFLLVFSCK